MVKKKTKKIPLVKKQRSRAKYSCPPALSEMIEIVNLLPPDFPLVPLEKIFERELREEELVSKHFLAPLMEKPLLLMRALPKTFPGTSLVSIMKSVIEKTPEEFQSYIENNSHLGSHQDVSEESQFNAMAHKYIYFCDSRNSLENLIRHLEREREVEKRRLYPKAFTWNLYPLSLTVRVNRSVNGELCFDGLPAILGTFDDSRLRKCKIETCNRIFWAKREDSKTCSSVCLNLFNVRKSRSLTDEQKAERKAKRDANRAVIKQGKAKPIKRSKK